MNTDTNGKQTKDQWKINSRSEELYSDARAIRHEELENIGETQLNTER